MTRKSSGVSGQHLMVAVGAIIGVVIALGSSPAVAEQVAGYKCSESNNSCPAGEWKYCKIECDPTGCSCILSNFEQKP